MSWLNIYHLGDLRVAIPLAGAIAAWLLTAGARRGALLWCAAVAAGLALVGSSKIAFLGWGVAIDPLDFRAASGHAAAATMVWPVALLLALRPHGRFAARGGLVLGWLGGATVVAALVMAGEHTFSEAVAGWVIGVCVSAFVFRHLEETALAMSTRSIATVALVAALASWCVHASHVNGWMVHTALALSGAEKPYSWHDC